MMGFIDYVYKHANTPNNIVGEFVEDMRDGDRHYRGMSAYDFMVEKMNEYECSGEMWRGIRKCYDNYTRYCRMMHMEFEHLKVDRGKVTKLRKDSHGVYIVDKYEEGVTKRQKYLQELAERRAQAVKEK